MLLKRIFHHFFENRHSRNQVGLLQKKKVRFDGDFRIFWDSRDDFRIYFDGGSFDNCFCTSLRDGVALRLLKSIALVASILRSFFDSIR